MKKLVIIDDSPQLRYLIEAFMGDEYAVSSFETVAAAELSMRNSRPDAILLDLGLPDKDGFAFLNELKQDEYRKFIPVIVLSASEKSADRIKALELGADDFLLKPFHPDELKLRIKKTLKYAYYAN